MSDPSLTQATYAQRLRIANIVHGHRDRQIAYAIEGALWGAQNDLLIEKDEYDRIAYLVLVSGGPSHNEDAGDGRPCIVGSALDEDGNPVLDGDDIEVGITYAGPIFESGRLPAEFAAPKTMRPPTQLNAIGVLDLVKVRAWDWANETTRYLDDLAAHNG